MKQVLTLLMLFWLSASFAQKYSYQFSGKLSPEKQVEFLTRVANWNYFQEVKLLTKENSGELLFLIPLKEKRSEEEAPVSMTDLKSLFLEFDLVPTNFIELVN